MALSPSHKFGQIIGDLLEDAVAPILQKFAEENDLYLDKKGLRPARPGSKLSWRDLNGNVHDLDFVLEKNGSRTRIGTPAAFIETAWRRYTKHSKNKAQEIQGAIIPLVETYKQFGPFFGTILAGEFTENALTQLKSLGFAVLYFPYKNIVKAFKVVDIDASWEQETSDSEIESKITAWETLSKDQHIHVAQALIDMHTEEIKNFIAALKNAVTRQIESVRILPLHGNTFNGESIEAAIDFIKNYNEASASFTNAWVRYEIEIKYLNGDLIKANFQDKERTLEFLHIHLPINPLLHEQLDLFE